jgi:hypothetical protein
MLSKICNKNHLLHLVGILFPHINDYVRLTHTLLTTTIVAPPCNASKWQMGFNSAFKELRPRIFSNFRTIRVVGRQPNAPTAFTPEEIPGTYFQRLSRPQGTWFCRKEPRKKSQVTPPGIDPGTVRLVAQRLNHCATPGPTLY